MTSTSARDKFAEIQAREIENVETRNDVHEMELILARHKYSN